MKFYFFKSLIFFFLIVNYVFSHEVTFENATSYKVMEIKIYSDNDLLEIKLKPKTYFVKDIKKLSTVFIYFTGAIEPFIGWLDYGKKYTLLNDSEYGSCLYVEYNKNMPWLL